MQQEVSNGALRNWVSQFMKELNGETPVDAKLSPKSAKRSAVGSSGKTIGDRKGNSKNGCRSADDRRQPVFKIIEKFCRAVISWLIVFVLLILRRVPILIA